MKRPMFKVSICIFVLFCLYGCKRYEIKVVFEDQKAINENATVRIDGVPAGFVRSVTRTENNTTALLVLKNRKIVKQKIREGIRACVAKDGGIDLDASNVSYSSAILSSGALIEANCPEIPFLKAIKKYKIKQTAFAAILGFLLVLAAYFIFRLFFRTAFLTLCVVLAVGAALVFYPILQPWVEKFYEMYPINKPLHEIQQPTNIDTKTKSQIKSKTVRQSTGIMEKISKTIQIMPRPHPTVVSFAICWLISFILMATLLGFSFRALRKT